MKRALRIVAITAMFVALVSACGSSSGSDASDTTAGGATTAPATTAAAETTTTAPAPKDITIHAGLNDPEDPTIAVLQFAPAKVTVPVGETIGWEWNGTEPHSVTFLPPGKEIPAPDPLADATLLVPAPAKGPIDGSTLVGSGLVPLGPGEVPRFEVSFAKPGTYTYHCIIHPQMVGTVDVVDEGAKGDTPAEVATEGQKELDQWLTEGRDLKQKLDSAAPVKTANSDGSSTWTVEMGVSGEHTDVLAFGPLDAAIKAGDSVTFVDNSSAPHTATFYGGTAPITNPLDPKVAAPAPGPSPQSLGLTGFFNTGQLPPNAPPGGGPPLAVRSFTFKVPAAGKYKYVCLLHESSGMAGSITAT